MTDTFKLYGRLFLTFTIEAITGLLIGGNDTGLEIGGVDKVVIRNPLTREPYIPGSSLRGKMRSQLEKRLGVPQNQNIGPNVKIHNGLDKDDNYTPIGHVFGVTGDKAKGHPTLLVVRDAALQVTDDLRRINFTETKTEVAIDRVTSAATPRTLERVPAGAKFGPAELVFSIYSADDFQWLSLVLQGLQLVEEDYLGAAGSRGSGKVKFSDLKVSAGGGRDYAGEHTVAALLDNYADLEKWAKNTIKVD